MTLLDVSITNVALPAIGESTGASPAQLQWIVSSYILSFGLVPVLAGRLGDDHGRRLMFMVGVAGFVVSSALSGVSPGGGLLIVARVLQGLSGGLINPQVSGLIQQMFRGSERGRAFGVIGTVVGLGTALGPLVGGGLIALGGPDFGWRLVFFVNVPIGAVVLLAARRWLPRAQTGGRHKLDVIGAAMLGGGIFCVLFAAVEYDAMQDTRLGWLGVPAIVLLGTFFRRETRLTKSGSDPLIDLRLFHRPSYTAGVLLALFFFCAMTGLPLVLALYYQQGLGYTALQSGLGVTAFALGTSVAAPLAGRVVTRVGRPLVVGACLTFGLGSFMLGQIAQHSSGRSAVLAFALPLFVAGLGSGALITPNQTLSLADVDPVVGSTAGGVLQTSQRIGSAIGQSVIGAAYFAALPAGVDDLNGGERGAAYGDALGQAVVVALCFVVVALSFGVYDLIKTERRRRSPGSPASAGPEVVEPYTR